MKKELNKDELEDLIFNLQKIGEDLFEKYGIKSEFDVKDIDLDVLKALEKEQEEPIMIHSPIITGLKYFLMSLDFEWGKMLIKSKNMRPKHVEFEVDNNK